jgi:ferredoxin
MADKNSKVAQSVVGKFYVDQNCISCGQCAAIASDYFKENSDGLMHVYQQPANEDGVKLCKEALDSCPVSAIGDDGE